MLTPHQICYVSRSPLVGVPPPRGAKLPIMSKVGQSGVGEESDTFIVIALIMPPSQGRPTLTHSSGGVEVGLGEALHGLQS